MSSTIIDYPYQDNIRTPTEIGINDRGTIPQLGRNVRGLIEYVKLLVSGPSTASATGQPLGNRYFLKTGAKCQALDTCVSDISGNSVCEETDRYVYINNIPSGRVPFISSGAGVNFTQFRGLIPGAMENLNTINPAAIFRAFRNSSTPECKTITMGIIDTKNNYSEQSHYVTLEDIADMDPCIFTARNNTIYNRTNPVSGQRCRETFQNPVASNAEVVMPDDPLDQLYFAGLAGIGIYVFYRIMEKAH
jgi:hypothetical protein